MGKAKTALGILAGTAMVSLFPVIGALVAAPQDKKIGFVVLIVVPIAMMITGFSLNNEEY